ncbi:MAG TPA: sulfatase [Planctomycetota bacterium]|nr:sulfatase [Planctomycetota bacterium]
MLKFIPVAVAILCASILLAADPRPNILFCIADDASYPHFSANGDNLCKTPNFDQIAREGIRFTHAFCASPSCTPSRGAILTGQAVHRLESGANLWSTLPAKFETYPDTLEKNGYVVGFTRKGWGPGQNGERKRNPAGPNFKTYADFMKTVPADKPFCFWFGSHDPHRPYEKGEGVKLGLRLEDVRVPAFLPDFPEVRSDILDYYARIMRFDRDVGECLRILEASGRAKNTIVVITSDNGMPFPRAKANLYDSGTIMPLAIRWPDKIKPGRVCDLFTHSTDFAPTFLEAASLKPLPEMTGHSLLDILLSDSPQPARDAGETPAPQTSAASASSARDHVFLERERHANVREGDLGYPCRAIRTNEFLYIRNLALERWPAGDPKRWKSVGPFGDIDGGPTKEVVLSGEDEKNIIPKFFKLACEKRPAEELYDLAKDPNQLTNVAADPAYQDAKRQLRARLDKWQADTNDPRAKGWTDAFDKYPYNGPDAKE